MHLQTFEFFMFSNLTSEKTFYCKKRFKVPSLMKCLFWGVRHSDDHFISERFEKLISYTRNFQKVNIRLSTTCFIRVLIAGESIFISLRSNDLRVVGYIMKLERNLQLKPFQLPFPTTCMPNQPLYFASWYKNTFPLVHMTRYNMCTL